MHKKVAKKVPKGIVVFGTMLILGSLYETTALFSPRFFTYYKSLFPELPASLLGVRLFLSLVRRPLGLLLGLGLLGRKEFWRKITILWGYFIIATLYWRHPLTAIQIHTRFVLNTLVQSTGSEVWTQGYMVDLVPIGSLIFLFLGDIIFWSALIYYLLRPTTKAWFQTNASGKQ
ncbi:MAG: hypothetical protein AMJ95_03925 [Omnitrophica WOR_2 bacterium SM23_72]|nr:MAG: hypothetical protein AMJ95_03925 [Omnitrophica WOR_2 bacterium SM23_72]